MISKAYEVVTDRIIKVIEESGELPWKRPWKRGKMKRGINRISGQPYNGINSFMTALFTDLQGFDSNEWVTFHQAKQLGGNIKKGEHGIPCVFFKLLSKDGSEVVAEGETSQAGKIPFAKYSTIFNLSQCEGIPYEGINSTSTEMSFSHEPIEDIEKLISEFQNKPEIVHTVNNRAYYQPSSDIINIPEMGEFSVIEEYYTTVFHELIHSTGHKDRLNRKGMVESHGFGSHEYSKEELVAEMGACFLSSDANFIDKTLGNSAAYLKGWLTTLKANPSWLVSAANSAQKAVDFLYGKKIT